MFVVISVLWGSVAAGYLLRRHPVPGLDRIMTYAVWCMLFLMGTEVGGNTLLMRSLGSLGLEAALLVVFTTLGCSVPALWLWRKARTKAESCPVPAGTPPEKGRWRKLFGQLAGSLVIVAFFAAGLVAGHARWLTGIPAGAGIRGLMRPVNLRRPGHRTERRPAPESAPHRPTTDVASCRNDNRHMGRRMGGVVPITGTHGSRLSGHRIRLRLLFPVGHIDNRSERGGNGNPCTYVQHLARTDRTSACTVSPARFRSAVSYLGRWCHHGRHHPARDFTRVRPAIRSGFRLGTDWPWTSPYRSSCPFSAHCKPGGKGAFFRLKTDTENQALKKPKFLTCVR